MERSIVDRFEKVAAVGSWMERLDATVEMRYKTHLIASVGSRSDASDASHAMRSQPFNKTRARDAIRWTTSAPDRRASIALPLIQHSMIGHVTCTFKTLWNLVPHGEN